MKKRMAYLLVLLSFLLTSCAGFLAASTPTATPRQTNTPHPSASPTPTVVIVEHDSPDKIWFEEVIFSVARENGCEPTVVVSYDPEPGTVPWTVDQEDNTVQSATYINLCGPVQEEADTSQLYLMVYRMGGVRAQYLERVTSY